MKILLGVQGTGNGHLSRSAALLEALNHYQVDVDVIISGRDRDGFFDMQNFGNWQWRQGLSFKTQNGKVNFLETLKTNQWQQFWRDVNDLDLSGYDLVVTDFEPVVAWAARKQNKRCIGLGRQYAFYHRSYSLSSTPLQRQIIRGFAPVSDAVGMHWLADADHIVPPIIHKRGHAHSVTPKHYLVYLPFESLMQVHRLLTQFTQYQFSVFHPQATRQKLAGINYYPLSRTAFAEAFSRAEGVLSNAGFETSSEALAQGKKLLVKPLNGQFEQQANATCLRRYGLGHVTSTLVVNEIGQWLENSSSLQCYWPEMSHEIADWLLKGAEQPVAELSKKLWRRAEQFDYAGLLRCG